MKQELTRVAYLIVMQAVQSARDCFACLWSPSCSVIAQLSPLRCNRAATTSKRSLRRQDRPTCHKLWPARQRLHDVQKSAA